ncbi:hypothetical protein [Candidatus Vallotia cooleyia]|nr:hypothetical protein [Candidatus Vallotia cooleyia]
MPLGKPPTLSVFGGKITTFRKLAKKALNGLSDPLSITHGLDSQYTAAWR